MILYYAITYYIEYTRRRRVGRVDEGEAAQAPVHEGLGGLHRWNRHPRPQPQQFRKQVFPI